MNLMSRTLGFVGWVERSAKPIVLNRQVMGFAALNPSYSAAR